MKFIVFNLVVVLALVFLILGKDGATDSLSRLGFAEAEVMPEMTPAPDVPQPVTLARAAPAADEQPVAEPVGVTSAAAEAARPDPVREKVVELDTVASVSPAPVPASPDTLVEVAETNESPAALSLATDVPPDVAQRRAEVLGDRAPQVLRPAVSRPIDREAMANRRLQLQELAEQMELMAAEAGAR